VDDINLPNTDSPQVMQQAVSLLLTSVLWEQNSRDVHPDKWEEALLELYARVYGSVNKAHGLG
jgi:hypothetical protein